MTFLKTSAVCALGIALALACLPAAARAAEPPVPCMLSSADTMEKVFRDEPWTRPAADKLVIAAAKNEVEGIQLVVAPAGAWRRVVEPMRACVTVRW